MANGRGAPLCREGDNTLNILRVPIIFVPGIMGSRLHFTNINEYWDPDSRKWRMLHWLRIPTAQEMRELHYRSPAEVMTVQDKVDLEPDETGRGWEGVAWSSYGVFLRFLSNEDFSPAECPIYCVGYDWRQSNRDSGNYLVNKIEEYRQRENAERVIILTHSMGGLIARSAMKQSSNLAARVLGVIHVVQPAVGAVALYRRFFTGAVSSVDGGWGFSTILGNTSDKFAAILSGLPGAIELLPTQAYRDASGANWLGYMEASAKKYWTGNVYDWYRSTTIPPGLPDSTVAMGIRASLLQRLNEAEYFHHRWLNGYKHPTRTWAIYSSGLETDMATVFDPPTRPPDRYEPRGDRDIRVETPWPHYGAQMQRRAQGDGTVPDTSGAALFPDQRNPPQYVADDGVRQYRVEGVEHEPAYNDPNVQALVTELIRYFISRA